MACMKRLAVLPALTIVCPYVSNAGNMHDKRPNIVIILNDDMGYRDLSCFGASDISTPNVDALAGSGIRFTDFYVASSVSSASRAALLTGCYPQKVGVQGVFFPTASNGLDPKFTTMAEILRSAGYATAAVGKWHLGDEEKYMPLNQGFDEYFGVPYSNDMYPSRYIPYSENCTFREGFSKAIVDSLFAVAGTIHPKSMRDRVPLVRDSECVEFPCDQATLTGRYADESIRFIRENAGKNRPFFLYLANTMPHVPLYVSDSFKGSSRRGLYGDVIQEIDYNVGRIMDVLEEEGLRDNTIVIFLSDNGPWLAVGKDAGCSDPLFEGKFTAFEGGFRVPAIISWPGQIPEGRVCDGMVSSIDLFPTLSKIAGAVVDEDSIDGLDISRLLKNPDAASPRKEMFMVYQSAAVRSGKWKYHAEGMVYQVKKTKRDETGPALYDLSEDISEQENLEQTHRKVADRLKALLDSHLSEIGK